VSIAKILSLIRTKPKTKLAHKTSIINITRRLSKKSEITPVNIEKTAVGIIIVRIKRLTAKLDLVSS
jgi:hypothetical protein